MKTPTWRARPALDLAVLIAAGGFGFVLERSGGLRMQLLLAAIAWTLLLLASVGLSTGDRRRVVALLTVATVGEVIGSLVLGLYDYRAGGIPLFVPPGHGMIFATGLRMADSRLVRRHRRTMVAGAFLATATLGIARPPDGLPGDTVGILAAAALLVLLLRARQATLFASIAILVNALELYGTAIGTWRWAPGWPQLGMTLGNPPLGVALGYLGFDWIALRLASAMHRTPP